MASNRNSKRRKNNVISYDAYLNGDLDNRNYQRVEYRTTSNNERNKRARTKSAERFAKLKDYSLLFTLLLLIIFGLIMLYSTSSYEAYATYSDSAYYFKKQLQCFLQRLVQLFAFQRVASLQFDHFHCTARSIISYSSVNQMLVKLS